MQRKSLGTIQSQLNQIHMLKAHLSLMSNITLWAGHVALMGEKRNAYRLLVGKPEGRGPLGRPRRRWMDNIKMDFVEVGWGDVNWIALAQDGDRWRALVNSVLNLFKLTKKIKLRGLSPRANYTDRATAACRRS
jgi:hypothetical protein